MLHGAVAIEVPNESELLDIAAEAARMKLHLITDGRETLLSPIVPPGWWKLAVTVKPAPLDGPLSAA